MLADIRKDLIRKVLKRMFIVVLVIILLWLTAVGTVWLVSIAENGGEIPLNTDATIVLGAQVLPSVYEKAPQPIICCGAQGDDEPAPEGAVMRDYLVVNGVPEAAVTAETESYNTYQNLENARKLLPEGIRRVLIVTSDYHVPRALWIARDKGFEAVGAGSPTYWKWRFKNHTKEALSWLKYAYMKLTGQV